MGRRWFLDLIWVGDRILGSIHSRFGNGVRMPRCRIGSNRRRQRLNNVHFSRPSTTVDLANEPDENCEDGLGIKATGDPGPANAKSPPRAHSIAARPPAVGEPGDPGIRAKHVDRRLLGGTRFDRDAGVRPGI
jgi:hypothetical protein